MMFDQCRMGFPQRKLQHFFLFIFHKCLLRIPATQKFTICKQRKLCKLRGNAVPCNDGKSIYVVFRCPVMETVTDREEIDIICKMKFHEDFNLFFMSRAYEFFEFKVRIRPCAVRSLWCIIISCAIAPVIFLVCRCRIESSASWISVCRSSIRRQLYDKLRELIGRHQPDLIDAK